MRLDQADRIMLGDREVSRVYLGANLVWGNAFSPASLFAQGEPGVWYDPSDFSTMFQDSAGTTPVTAVEQPVGLMLDKSGNGNHAYQTTATSRPVLSARYNLLTKTEQFDNAAWTKANVALTVNGAVAPDGTTTADLVYPSSTGSATAIYQGFALPAGSYSVSFALKAAGKRWVAVDGTNTTAAAYFDLQDGVVGTVAAGHAAFISSLGSGWYRCTVTNTTPGGYGYFAVRPVDADGTTSVTANGTSGIYIWGASLVPADQASLPYQRVNTATDYDADPAKFPHYLRFDGVDDWLVTNTITPGIDKAQVFAGVRKLSDAAIGMIVETTTNAGTVGGVALTASGWWLVGGARYGVASKSSDNIDYASGDTAANYASPITNILCSLHDLTALALQDMTRLRVNSINTSLIFSDTRQGVGGLFPNGQLYIGRRGGTSAPFNGRIYSLIVRFGSNLPIETIERAEAWINSKTGAY